MERNINAEELRPLTGGQDGDIIPGPIIGPAPEPTEIVCIQVDKIYDACSQRHCFEDLQFRFQGRCEFRSCRVVPGSFKAECTLTQVQTDPPLVRARVDFTFRLEVRCDTRTETITIRASEVDDAFPKQVILFGFEEENFCKVEAVLECLGCDVFHADDTLTHVDCDVGVFLEIKTAAHVQLLVPAFGFCPVPPECQELPTRCEEFLTGPPPRRFPPQPYQLMTET